MERERSSSTANLINSYRAISSNPSRRPKRDVIDVVKLLPREAFSNDFIIFAR